MTNTTAPDATLPDKQDTAIDKAMFAAMTATESTAAKGANNNSNNKDQGAGQPKEEKETDDKVEDEGDGDNSSSSKATTTPCEKQKTTIFKGEERVLPCRECLPLSAGTCYGQKGGSDTRCARCAMKGLDCHALPTAALDQAVAYREALDKHTYRPPNEEYEDHGELSAAFTATRNTLLHVVPGRSAGPELGTKAYQNEWEEHRRREVELKSRLRKYSVRIPAPTAAIALAATPFAQVLESLASLHVKLDKLLAKVE